MTPSKTGRKNKVEIYSHKVTDVTTMDTVSLKKELVDIMKNTTKAVRRAADIIFELSRRGEHIPKIAIYGDYLSLVAGGAMHENVLVQFAHKKYLLDKIKAPFFSLKDQAKIASGNIKFQVVGEDKKTVTSKEAIDLSARDVRVIFGSNGLRSILEQKKILNKNNDKSALSVKRQAKTLCIDAKTKYLKFGNYYIRRDDNKPISYDELIKALSNFTKCDIEKFILKNAPKVP